MPSKTIQRAPSSASWLQDGKHAGKLEIAGLDHCGRQPGIEEKQRVPCQRRQLPTERCGIRKDLVWALPRMRRRSPAACAPGRHCEGLQRENGLPGARPTDDQAWSGCRGRPPWLSWSNPQIPVVALVSCGALTGFLAGTVAPFPVHRPQSKPSDPAGLYSSAHRRTAEPPASLAGGAPEVRRRGAAGVTGIPVAQLRVQFGPLGWPSYRAVVATAVEAGSEPPMEGNVWRDSVTYLVHATVCEAPLARCGAHGDRSAAGGR